MADEANQELQNAGGAEATAEGAAASTSEAEAKASGGETRADAADPAGTAGAPAAQAEQSGEQTAAASPDRKDADGGQNQPGETARPPVAGPLTQPPIPGDIDRSCGASIVVTGPKQGRWRAGRRFDRESVRIPLAELTDDELAALEADPRLTVVFECEADGELSPRLRAPENATRRSGKPGRRRR